MKSKEKSAIAHNSSNKNKYGINPQAFQSQIKSSKLPPPKNKHDTLDEEEDDEYGDILC